MGLQDMTLRPSLKDIDEELLHLVAEQSVANDMLAEKRQKDQALLDQMLPPQVNTIKPCHVAFINNYDNNNNNNICKKYSNEKNGDKKNTNTNNGNNNDDDNAFQLMMS